jgi:Rod binding domain-containing protein
MATSVGLGSLNVQSNLLQANQERMISGMKSTPGVNDSAKIDKGARDFEAVLVGSWLQQAEQSFATVPGAEDDENAAGREQVMSYGVQSLATSLAASGGIGIGKMVAKAMHARADKANGDSPIPAEAPTKRVVEEKSIDRH